MDSLIFKQGVWKAKQPRFDAGLEVQTRRLDGLKDINEEPEKRSLVPNLLASNGAMKFKYVPWLNAYPEFLWVKPRFHPGQVVYRREKWAVNEAYDYRAIPQGTSVWFPNYIHVWAHRGRWRGPYSMPAWAARDFARITAVRAELFSIAGLPVADIDAEGGPAALKFLRAHEGLWNWVYSFVKAEKQALEQVKL